MIIVTGGAGFIGSAFVWKCNTEGRNDVLIVDNLNTSEKWQNLVGLSYQEYYHKDDFLGLLLEGVFDGEVEAIVHMGACSATTEHDMDYLMDNNYRYTVHLANWCLENNVRFIYASSAATYGNGEHGFNDDHAVIPSLRPINRYGYSKQLFDVHALREGWLDKIAGLKFFNVYGPNEYHKQSMRSVMCKSFPDIRDKSEIKLFKSYHPEYSDGGQKRDFVYVKDCVNVMWWLVEHGDVNGIFNVGTGTSRTWNDVANAMFSGLNKPSNIVYIDMPEELKNQYQYYTEARMDKLIKAGFDVPFMSLEDAIKEYVGQYLSGGHYLA